MGWKREVVYVGDRRAPMKRWIRKSGSYWRRVDTGGAITFHGTLRDAQRGVRPVQPWARLGKTKWYVGSTANLLVQRVRRADVVVGGEPRQMRRKPSGKYAYRVWRASGYAGTTTTLAKAQAAAADPSVRLATEGRVPRRPR